MVTSLLFNCLRDPDLIRVTHLSNSDSIYSLSHTHNVLHPHLPETLDPKILCSSFSFPLFNDNRRIQHRSLCIINLYVIILKIGAMDVRA
uniref:Uncharacterized protein n=1 Tax=Helianthus annuus TaxID=4232 RepID=A0A251T019_HELAN